MTGLVQGVGFRPFVHRVAMRHGIAGWVRNAAGAVEIFAEGERSALRAFVFALRHHAPVLARLETCDVLEAIPEGHGTFAIAASHEDGEGRLPVSPDVAMCDACAAELADPDNRRYRYPFITCTDCGPRFTVIESMPYDRVRTSMRAFQQCPACASEYATPSDRRYHSETNSCPACGPRLWFESPGEAVPVRGADAAIARAAAVLLAGGIVALRGLGGFHLAVDATDEAAVQRLRARKRREAKPLAVMVRTLAEAARYAAVSPREAVLLSSPARPIVTLSLTCDAAIAPALRLAASIAPGLRHVGLMLAYTPLHLLLLERVGRPLVMTSGNLSDEPIATGNDEARERLAVIADGLLLHDREIVARYDDSVMRVAGETPVFLRRGRGHAPAPLELPVASPQPLLAVGPHLKNTFTLVHGGRAFVSQHIGDLENLETVEHFRDALARYRQLFRVEPAAVVHDLHPGYLSTRLAQEMGVPVLPPVQHHHAHVAAVMAEHGRVEPVIGVAFDGTGYGDDGHVWGGEVLLADLTGYRRLAQLRYAPLPGGDAAARAPWRTAVGYASMHGGQGRTSMHLDGVEARALATVARQIASGLNTPRHSSMGRLFDAAAAVIGVRHESRYEGQAAMELEALAADHPGEVLPYHVELQRGEERFGREMAADSEPRFQLDPLPLLVALAERRRGGATPEALAAAFHDTIADATVTLVDRVRARTRCATVALGGGCFQNARLLTTVRHALVQRGFDVLVPERFGPNDGAVSLGQAAVAAARLQRIPSRVATAGATATTHGG